MNHSHSTSSVRKKEKSISLTITLLVWGGILVFLFLYKITIPKLEDTPEAVTAMLINFGDNENGNGTEEPANQSGSANVIKSTEVHSPISPTPSTPAPPLKEKILTGESTNLTVKKNKDNIAKTISNTAQNSKNKNSLTASNTTQGSKARGDGRGNEAIGNLIRGKGSNTGTQGTGGNSGNAGDPLGGDGNGDSRIGIDRRLISFIPGTMNRGGIQPEHQCSATGTIVIDYTVDKTGKVTSAKRKSGSLDPCIVSTATTWVKQYVKAESAQAGSSGTYKITF